jgi:hypothetical protein
MGIGDSDGVSYGYIQQTPGSSTFTTSGVHVPQLNVEIVLALIGAADRHSRWHRWAIRPDGLP